MPRPTGRNSAGPSTGRSWRRTPSSSTSRHGRQTASSSSGSSKRSSGAKPTPSGWRICASSRSSGPPWSRPWKRRRDEQAIANDFFGEMDIAGHGKIKVLNNPIKLSKTPAGIKCRAPELGEHTAELLAGVGVHARGDRGACRKRRSSNKPDDLMKGVTPAKAGVPCLCNHPFFPDAGFRRYDAGRGLIL